MSVFVHFFTCSSRLPYLIKCYVLCRHVIHIFQSLKYNFFYQITVDTAVSERGWIFRVVVTEECNVVVNSEEIIGIVQLKRDGTRWRTGGEVKGKLANGVGSQSSSHRFTLPWNLVYPALLPLMRTPRLPAMDWTDATADLNGLVRFAERPNLVSTRVSSHFKRTLPQNIWRDRRRVALIDAVITGSRVELWDVCSW